MSDKIALERRYGATNYDPLPVVLSRGEGVWLWDDQGKRYLDMLSAYSAVSFGYGHPRLVAALETQARRLAVTSRAFYSDRLPPFLAKICEVTGMDRALPMSTGAECVETAIKCSRNWAYTVMASSAWSDLVLPEQGRWAEKYRAEKRSLLRMEFSTFCVAMIQVPCQIVRTAGRIVYRLLSWNPWQGVFLRLVERLHGRRLC